MHIEADTPEIEKYLVALSHLINDGNGWTHPEIIFRAQDGALSVEKKGPPDDQETLVVLNSDILIPTDELNITIKNDQLYFEPVNPAGYSKVLHEITDVMFALYNLTGKVRQTRAADFWLNCMTCRTILDLVMSARTIGEGARDTVRMLETGLSEDKMIAFLVSRFLESRCLGFETRKADGKPGKRNMQDKKGLANHQGVSPVIMPVIDFFNHHPLGATYFSPDLNSLQVRCRKPVAGSDECYLLYGLMDAMDTWVHYGFIDSRANLVRSVPVQIKIPGTGRIEVKSTSPNSMAKLQLPENIRDLEPYLPIMERNQDILTISHLYIPVGHSPYMLKRILGLCIAQLAGPDIGIDMHQKLIREAEGVVIEQNLTFYRNLRRTCETMKAENPVDTNPAIESALHLACVQEEKVASYSNMMQ